MDDTPGVGLNTSPYINSVLKPPRPRVPLKDILSAANDEDNTASRKRRVSFANVNKIKEFSAGAESMVVCNTPAYEEPFSVSSDSSYPSGVDGETPAKTEPPFNPVPIVFYAEQKENMLVGTVSHHPSILQFPPGQNMSCPSDLISKQSLEASRSSLPKSRLSGVFFQGDTLCGSPSSSPLDDMDFTDCIDIRQGTARNSTIFSVGADLTSVVGQPMKSMSNHSSEGMDLTEAAFPLQQVNDQQLTLGQSDVNLTDVSSLNDSDTLKFTDNANEPRSVGATTIPPTLTENFFYRGNNTKYLESGMDLTKAAFSRSSAGRRSTRYSLNNMDLTEAIGSADYSKLEFTEVIKGARMSTRYSMNEMDLTDAVVNKNYTRFSTNSMECTGVIEGEMDFCSDSETSMDFTKQIHNVYQSPYKKGTTLPTDKMESTSLVGGQNGEQLYYSSMALSKISASYTEADNKSLSEEKELSTTPITEECQIQITKTVQIPPPNSSSYENKNYHSPTENIQNQSIPYSSMKIQSEPMQDLKSYEMSLHFSTICDSPQNDKSVNKIAVNEIVDNVISNPSNHTSYKMDLTTAALNSSEKSAEESHHSNVLNSINVSSAEGVEKSRKCADKIKSARILTSDVEILDKHNITTSSNFNLDSSNALVLSNLTNITSSEVVDGEKPQTELLGEIVEMDTSVLSIGDQPCIKEELSYKEELMNSQSGVVVSDRVLQNPNENDDTMEILTTENNNSDDVAKTSNTSQKIYEISNTLASILKCNDTHQKSNETSINFEDDKSCGKVSQKDSGVKDVTANDSQVLSISPTIDSINRTLCSKNITMTRGGSRKYNTTLSQDSSESVGEDSVILVSGETSVLESSLVIPQFQTKRQTIDGSEINYDVTRDEYSAAWEPAKGKKRSFDIALEPENDTKESPVKLMCLEKVEYISDNDLLMNVTAPSFLINTLNTQNETMSVSHHSPTTSTTGSFSRTCKTESAGQTCLENKSLLARAVDMVEHLGLCEEDNFSLQLNISAEVSVSTKPLSHDKVCHIQMDVTEAHRIVDQNKIEEPEFILNLTPDHVANSTLNYSHTQESGSTVNDNFISQNKLPIVQNQSQILEAPNHFQINNYHAAKVDCVRVEQPKTSNNIRAPSEIRNREQKEMQSAIHKQTESLRKTGRVRRVKDGVYLCNLIPQWIELQFSVEISGIISKPTYKVVALERDWSVAEYVLQQLKMVVLPQDVSGLLSLLQDTRIPFLTQVAQDISFICGYHNGTLKGNILTFEVVSMRHRQWVFIDVNIKYPQHLSETDVTISEQRIGELKLSLVRQVFSTIEKGPEVLFNFAESMKKLKFLDV